MFEVDISLKDKEAILDKYREVFGLNEPLKEINLDIV